MIGNLGLTARMGVRARGFECKRLGFANYAFSALGFGCTFRWVFSFIALWLSRLLLGVRGRWSIVAVLHFTTTL
jgi:hypothetical protein